MRRISILIVNIESVMKLILKIKMYGLILKLIVLPSSSLKVVSDSSLLKDLTLNH